MTDELEKLPLDARLLSYAIIELNISRHNVSIYPKEHPSVDRSLTRAFQFLRKLFEIRPEITLAIAKDTIVIDKYQLDKKNPVFRDFALNLNQMHIAYITFKTGVTKDDLYKFHRFLLEKSDDLTVAMAKEVYKKYNLMHLHVGFVDYRSFAFGKTGSVPRPQNAPLWEKYIYGLLEGKLQNGEVSEEVRDIPPEMLATLLNKASGLTMKEESYDRVITTYMKSSSETSLSTQDLKKVMECINSLKPELKKRFLSSAMKTITKDMGSAYQALKKMPVEEITGLLGTISEQRLTIPPTLMNLLDRLSSSGSDHDQGTIYLDEDDMDTDDILRSEDISQLLNEEDADKPPVSKSPVEIQKIMDYDATELKTSHLMEFENEFSDDLLDKKFNQIILELMLSEVVSEREYTALANILRDQTEQLLWTGEYGLIIKALNMFESNKAQGRFSAMNTESLQYFDSAEFMLPLIESFRILGKQKRKEVAAICEYYDTKIIPYLLDALTEEESLTVRRFLMDLLKEFGDKVIPEASKRLHDERWFVKRNMLYILSETNCGEETITIKYCCQHENPKVSTAAIRCLLNIGNRYPIEIILDYLHSKDHARVEQGIALAGTFRITEAVGDLIQLLQGTSLTGADLKEKIQLIKALGDIGDSQAVNALRDLVSNTSFLFKGTIEQLKEEVYKTLKNYPYDAVKDLVEEGIQSKNKIIQAEALRLSRFKAK